MKAPSLLKLQNAPFPKMMGELMHSNQLLKVFSLSALVLVFMISGVLFVVSTKAPVIISLGTDGKSLKRMDLPKLEDQVKEGIRHYLENRYQWRPEDVRKKLKRTEQFISPSALKPFLAAAKSIEKFSTEKIVSQKVYPESIEVNMDNKTVLIKGDRVTSIQGLKAAGNLKLELSFELGPRTHLNPWGLYITKEREE